MPWLIKKSILKRIPKGGNTPSDTGWDYTSSGYIAKRSVINDICIVTPPIEPKYKVCIYTREKISSSSSSSSSSDSSSSSSEESSSSSSEDSSSSSSSDSSSSSSSESSSSSSSESSSSSSSDSSSSSSSSAPPLETHYLVLKMEWAPFGDCTQTFTNLACVDSCIAVCGEDQDCINTCRLNSTPYDCIDIVGPFEASNELCTYTNEGHTWVYNALYQQCYDDTGGYTGGVICAAWDPVDYTCAATAISGVSFGGTITECVGTLAECIALYGNYAVGDCSCDPGSRPCGPI